MVTRTAHVQEAVDRLAAHLELAGDPHAAGQVLHESHSNRRGGSLLETLDMHWSAVHEEAKVIACKALDV